MSASDAAPRPQPRVAVLISGRGSNLLAIIKAAQSNTLPISVVAVISNKADAAGLAKAKQHGIPTRVVAPQAHQSRADYDRLLGDVLASFEPDWIALAGFMRVLGPDLVNRYVGQIVNIHPSLLPKYPGLDTHARAIAAGDKEHGASVHFVTDKLDGGPLIAQARVPLLATDTVGSLGERVLNIEHALYIRALQLCVSGAHVFPRNECYVTA